jgi:hypothetical protein
MMTLAPRHDELHRKAVAAAIARVLTLPELTMVHQCWAAENPGSSAPTPAQVLYWVRLNMPQAAERIEAVLYPAE